MLSPFFSQKLTDALGWTLLHSLWQGVVIAILMAVVLLFLNRRSAQVRYLVAISALFAVVTAAVVTFRTLYSTLEAPAVPALPSSSPIAVVAGPVLSNSISPVIEPSQSWMDGPERWLAYVEQNTPLMVAVWMLGILVLTLRLLGGLLYVQRLRHYQTQSVAPEWLETVQTLGKQMGLLRAVQLMESALVKVPMAIGYFKPVILLPVGTFTGLTPQQVEAILAHELAHIVRNDYWINIFQSIVEILFFFHPAVWWMSGIVRQEREHCCDDRAVHISGDTLTFVQALTHLEVMQAVPQLALPATGNRGSLLGRVQRLLQQTPQKPTLNEGMLVSGIVGLCLIAISASAFSNLNSSETQTLQNSISEQSKTFPSDSLSNKITFYSTFTDTNKVVREIIIVKDKKGNVTDVMVDGKKLSKNELKNYREIIDRKLNEAKEDNERLSMEDETEGLAPLPPLPPVPPVPSATPVAPVAPLPPLPPIPPVLEGNSESDSQVERLGSKIERLSKELGKIYEKQPYDRKKAAELVSKLRALSEELSASINHSKSDLSAKQQQIHQAYQDELRQYQEQVWRYEKELEQQEPGNEIYVRSRTETDKAELSKQREEMHVQQLIRKQQEQSHRDHERAMQEHAQAMAEHEKAMMEHKKAMEKHEKFVKVLVGELKKDGLIANERSYSIQITKKKLYVNDKEQPEKVFQKYKELIRQETGDDLDKWNDSQKMQINSNWEKRSTNQSLLQPYLWDLNKLMGKPEPKDNC